MTRRDLTLKWIAYLVGLAVVTIFNYNVFSWLPISLPLLLPMAAVAVGTLEGPRFGAGFGIVAGLVMATAGHRSLVCIILLSVFGWISGLLTVHALRRDLVGHLICAFSTMVLWETWQVGSRLVAHTAQAVLLLKVAVPELLRTIVLSLPVYWVFRFCCVHYGRVYHE